MIQTSLIMDEEMSEHHLWTPALTASQRVTQTSVTLEVQVSRWMGHLEAIRITD